LFGRGGTLGLVPLVVEVAGRDRTEDYQQLKGITTTQRTLCLCRDQGLAARTPATAELWLRAYDKAPLGQVQSFHASSSAKDLGSEYSRKHHCPSFVKAVVGTC